MSYFQIHSPVSFQFPQSERMSCNEPSIALCGETLDFQFPQSERMSCNLRLSLFVVQAVHFFQFPQSERMSCNCSRPPFRMRTCKLSVSTIGTNELQLLLAVVNLLVTGVLSVSTIGTNELQHTELKHTLRETQTFSFHNRNE